MLRKLVLVAGVLLGGLVSAATAHADLAPPPGYVESCTVDKQCTKEEDGDVCATYFKEPNKCKDKHASDGFVYRCKTRGGSNWSEVWCRPKAPGQDKAPDKK